MALLSNYLNDARIDVACITEHWLQTNVADVVRINNYKIASKCCRKEYKHGGTLILTRNEYRTTAIDIDENVRKIHIEASAVHLMKENMVILAVYRSQLGDWEIFRKGLKRILVYLFQRYPKSLMVVAGDFNINFILNTPQEREIKNDFATFGMQEVFKEYSRVTKNSSTCIDNIFISDAITLLRKDKKNANLQQKMYLPFRGKH